MSGILKRERLFFDLCESNTGLFIEPEAFAKSQKQNKEILDQSHELARRMENAGLQAYTDYSYGLWRVGLHTGKAVELPNFRKINFLPYIAQQNRKKPLKHLEYWLEKHPHDRFWTFTTGPRCPVSELRQHLIWMHRKISKLNHKPYMQRAGVSIVFRSSEVGSIEPFGDNKYTYHPHAHCMIHLERRIPKQQWTLLIKRVRAYMGGAYFSEDGIIRNAREACKYVVKPDDLKTLDEPELESLYYALSRLHLVQPLKGFKDHLQMIEDNKLKLIRIYSLNGSKWKIQPNWNSYTKKKKDPLPYYCRRSDMDNAPEAENVIVSRLAPAPFDYPITEPTLLVRNLRSVPKLYNNPYVKKLQEVTIKQWESGVCIYVHNTPITVPPRPSKKKAENLKIPGLLSEP